MQRRREIRSRHLAARPLCLSSQSAPFNMRVTYRSVGADEGQMRELMGYLVARNGGDEETAARMVAGIPQRILRGHLCRLFLRKRFLRREDQACHGWINESISAGIAIGEVPGI